MSAHLARTPMPYLLLIGWLSFLYVWPSLQPLSWNSYCHITGQDQLPHGLVTTIIEPHLPLTLCMMIKISGHLFARLSYRISPNHTFLLITPSPCWVTTHFNLGEFMNYEGKILIYLYFLPMSFSDLEKISFSIQRTLAWTRKGIVT